MGVDSNLPCHVTLTVRSRDPYKGEGQGNRSESHLRHPLRVGASLLRYSRAPPAGNGAKPPSHRGKTHEIGIMVVAATMAGLRVLILATRTRLVRQLHERLEAFGVRHGAVAARLPELLDYSATVQIASVDTLHRRAVVNERIPLPGADVVIFDEAHLATAETRLRILQSYPEALRIGFTAPY